MVKTGSSLLAVFLAEPELRVEAEGPPWSGPEAWAGVNQELACLIRGNRPDLDRAVQAAEAVRQGMGHLIPVWESLCAATQQQCQDNCCTAQRVWFDFRDLLLFHLLGLAIPPGQTRADLSEPCRYLSSRGCSLPRLTRPWRCSWYLCQPQVELLAAQPPKEQRRFSRLLRSVLENREEMDSSFRTAVLY